jgi:hypothetical protein
MPDLGQSGGRRYHFAPPEAIETYVSDGTSWVALTEPERKAVIVALRARMRTEAGTFHELLRRAVERMEAPDQPTSRGRSET